MKGGKSMQYLGVEEVKERLKIGTSKAYSIIRELNKELSDKGFMIVRGKVPEKYLLERFYFE